MSDCVNIFLLDRAELLFCEHTGGNFSACDSSRNLLHVSSFVVCGSSGDKFHTSGISCWTLAHCTRFSTSSIYLTPELVS